MQLGLNKQLQPHEIKSYKYKIKNQTNKKPTRLRNELDQDSLSHSLCGLRLLLFQLFILFASKLYRLIAFLVLVCSVF